MNVVQTHTHTHTHTQYETAIFEEPSKMYMYLGTD